MTISPFSVATQGLLDEPLQIANQGWFFGPVIDAEIIGSTDLIDQGITGDDSQLIDPSSNIDGTTSVVGQNRRPSIVSSPSAIVGSSGPIDGTSGRFTPIVQPATEMSGRVAVIDSLSSRATPISPSTVLVSGATESKPVVVSKAEPITDPPDIESGLESNLGPTIDGESRKAEE